MSKFGVFAQLVAVGGALASAAGALRLAFMKRSKWQPPEEAVPAVAARFAGLLAMVVTALLYVFGPQLGQIALGVITIVLFVVALVCLATAVRTNIQYSFYYPNIGQENDRKLGGEVLTKEAAHIQQEHNQNEQQMFEDAQGVKDLVWTRKSQAAINLRSTLSFIGLIGFGTCTLAAAAMLVVISISR